MAPLVDPAAPYWNHARPEVVALARPAGLRVLDVGCAAGAMGAAMLAAGAREVVGIESVPEVAAVARGRLSAVHSFDLDGPWPLVSPDLRFDVVTCADVLEHLKDPWAALARLRGLLVPGGRIVVSLPNVRHASVLLPLICGGRWDYVPAGILDRTHLRFFTPATALEMVRAAGFEVEQPVQIVMDGPAAARDPVFAALLDFCDRIQGNTASLARDFQTVQILIAARCP